MTIPDETRPLLARPCNARMTTVASPSIPGIANQKNVSLRIERTSP